MSIRAGIFAEPFNCRVFPFNCIVGGNSDSRLSLCFVAIRRSLLQEETDVAYAIIGELNGSGYILGVSCLNCSYRSPTCSRTGGFSGTSGSGR